MDDPEVKLTVEETTEILWKIATIPARIILSIWGVIWPEDTPGRR